MRIVHVYKDYFPPVRGGIEQTIERMARAQVAAGHAVTVLCSAHGGRRTVDEVVDGVRVVRVAEWGRALSAPFCPAMPWHLARLEADLYHLHFPNPTGEVSFLLARPHGALVVSYYSDVVRQAAALPLYGPVIDALLRRADLVLATSAPHVESSAFLRRHRDKCRVVTLGIDLAPFEGLEAHRAAGAALRARYGTPLVLFVGRLRYYKGLDVLLEAMTRVKGTLVIVGEGPEGHALRDQHRRLGLGAKVVFAGDVDESGLLDHLAAADVGVLPSTLPSEVFGLAMVEMMACGLPVVCTELGTGTSFVNQDGETGLVVPPDNPSALAAALDRLLADPTLRQRMGEAARRRVREHFSTAAMMLGIEAAYTEALASRRARAGQARPAGHGAAA
jgi:glycosyltransferase involved in cell wall biosynthesis